MNCDPASLVESAKCFRCVPPGMVSAVGTSLLCSWANNLTPVCVLQPETPIYEQAIIANGGTISAASLDYANTFICDCKRDGIWDKLWDVGLFIGDQLAAALVKLKDFSGVTPVLLNTTFINGDYTDVTGLVGDGATKYIDTGSITDTINLMSVYLRTPSPFIGSATLIGETINSTAGVYMTATTTLYHGHFGPGTSVRVPVQPFQRPLTPGLLSIVFNSLTDMRIYDDGTLGDTAAAIGGSVRSVNNLTAWLFGMNRNGALLEPTGATMSFYAMGDSFTDAEIGYLYNAVQKLQTSLGRQV